MRDYAKISPRFWIGRTGKEIRKLGPDAQIVALYLLTGQHANLLGLYHLPVLYIAADTALAPANVSSALDALSSVEFCAYDHDSEMVWVCEMARYQCLDTLVRQWFPNAVIVSDRFHVIRLIQHHFNGGNECRLRLCCGLFLKGNLSTA